VQDAKFTLSEEAGAALTFHDGPVTIDHHMARTDFEGWIAPEVEAIDRAVTELLERTEVAAERIDTIFLTGGSAFVPAVRRLFARRFGQSSLRGGEELTTVARGLAMSALSPGAT